MLFVRVDPADVLKLVIKWNKAFYVDLLIAFGWRHGSGSFQILSKKGVKLHCYIDDYIVVTLPLPPKDVVLVLLLILKRIP